MQLTSATQVIPNPVNPQIGENLWQMNYRQSIAIDDIMDTTTLCCNCDFFITQADIDANSGGFTITQPGNWCLGENIITSQPIIIADLPGVVFDLKGRTISSSVKGAVNLPTGIIDVTNSPGTIIKNGYLIGLDLTPPVDRRSGIRFSQSDGSIVQNVQAQFFATVDDPAVFEGNFAFFANFSNYVQFLDCFATGPFLAGFTIFGNNSIVKNCEVSHFSGYVVTPGPLTNIGVGFWLQGNNNYAENCTSSGGDAQPTPASSGSIGFLLQGNNNSVFQCTALHHKLNAYPTLGVDGGTGFYVRGDDCQIKDCSSSYNERFGIYNVGNNLVVCNNFVYNNSSNFYGTSDSDLCNLLCSDYISQNRLPYTITESGLYCVYGPLEETSGTAAITIADNVSSVVIEFFGYALERTSLIHTEPLIKIGNNCQDITIKNGRMNSSGTDSIENIGISIAGTGCRLIRISDLSFEGFHKAISAGDQTDTISFLNCESLDNNIFIFCVGTENIFLADCLASHGTSTTDGQITFSTNCNNIVIENTQTTTNVFDGIHIYQSKNVTISGLFSSQNGRSGLFLEETKQISVTDGNFFNNTSDGVHTSGVRDLLIGGCYSANNSGAGFFIRGDTGGAIPADCPVTIRDSTAVSNNNSGFYFTNVGGVVVTNCFSNNNSNGQGFHLDNGTWSTQVIDCTANYNGHFGFLTWDSSITGFTLYNTVFHNCNAAKNNTTGIYVPGFDDYSQANGAFIMTPGLAGPLPNGILQTTPVLGIPEFPADFCTFPSN
jgi:hypothetical protein